MVNRPPDPTARSTALSERHRSMLEFERTWWQLESPRDEVIRARFGCTADEYDAELHRVLELPEALAHDPIVVRRFDRRRQRRRRALLDVFDAGTGTSAETPFEQRESHSDEH